MSESWTTFEESKEDDSRPDDDTEVDQKTVLVAVDLTSKDDVFDFYMENVHKADHKVVILHVLIPDTTAYACPGPAISPMHVSNDVNRWEKLEERRFEHHYKVKLAQYKLEGDVIVKHGVKPGDTIVQEALDRSADLIVIGSGGNSICKYLMCTVSDHVFKNAHCPVIACHR